MNCETLYTSGDAARMLDLPLGTFISMEQRGAIGPFRRDTAGRRLLTDDDIAAVSRYITARKHAQGDTP